MIATRLGVWLRVEAIAVLRRPQSIESENLAEIFVR